MSTAYAPKFPDNPLERSQAVSLIKEALEAGVTLSQLEMQASAARVSQGEFRGKLAGFISTRYWEHKKHGHVIRATSYRPSTPRTDLDNVDLVP